MSRAIAGGGGSIRALVPCAMALWAALASPAVVLAEGQLAAPDPLPASAGTTSVDSVASAMQQSHARGQSALRLGLLCTLVPPLVAVVASAPGRHDAGAWTAALSTVGALGVLAGPAVGLASGGRGDLARRGLLVRGIGSGMLLAGAAAFVIGVSSSEVGPGGTALMVVGLAGAGVIAVSCIHDLAITPSAVEKGRRVTVAPLVDPAGRVGIRATF